MYLVRDVMSHAALYVTPDATVRAAVEILRANQLHALPVVEAERLVGVVDPLTLFLYNGEVPIRVLLGEAPATVSPETSVGEAATRMRQLGVRQLPVVRDDALIGMVSDRELLSAWGASTDVLTGLPWQDHLRRWAVQQLRSGHEISLLFVDLDDFGALNKKQGHVFGDRLLKLTATALRDGIRAERDCLCRFGGDEFLIASLRTLDEAEALARDLIAALREIASDGEELTVPASIGLSGGKRRGVRPGTHPDASLDDLINLASRASTQAKSRPDHLHRFDQGLPGEEPAGIVPEPEHRILVEGYSISQEDDQMSVTVELRHGDQIHRGRSCRAASEVRHAVAEATAGCLSRFIGNGIELDVEEVYGYTTTRGIPVCGATVVARQPGRPAEKLIGATPLLPDTYRSVMSAVLDAANRRLSHWLDSEPPPAPDL